MNWGNITMNTGTRLFEDKINIQLNGTVNPYVLNKRGNETREYELFSKNKRIGRLTDVTLTFGTQLRSSEGTKEDRTKQNMPENQNDINNPNNLTDQNRNKISNSNYSNGYTDFSIPWSINIDYSFSYAKHTKEEAQYIQTLRLSGDVSLTKKWKIGYNTGYDFTNKEISFTNVNITRDLHCWVATFNWVPFGFRKSYSFQINVKSTILQDLKYSKNESWYDNL
jgi:hypothetical protein